MKPKTIQIEEILTRFKNLSQKGETYIFKMYSKPKVCYIAPYYQKWDKTKDCKT